MPRFEVEIGLGQDPELFRRYLNNYWGAEIVTDELDIAEAKAHKLQTWQSRLDLLREPIPEELLDPVRMAYGNLFVKAIADKKDIALHVESIAELNLLQSTVHQLFEESRDKKRNRSRLTPQSGAVIVERFGLKNGQSRTFEDLATDLFMSPQRSGQLSSQAIASLRRPFLGPLFVPHFVTFKD